MKKFSVFIMLGMFALVFGFVGCEKDDGDKMSNSLIGDYTGNGFVDKNSSAYLWSNATAKVLSVNDSVVNINVTSENSTFPSFTITNVYCRKSSDGYILGFKTSADDDGFSEKGTYSANNLKIYEITSYPKTRGFDGLKN